MLETMQNDTRTGNYDPFKRKKVTINNSNRKKMLIVEKVEKNSGVAMRSCLKFYVNGVLLKN